MFLFVIFFNIFSNGFNYKDALTVRGSFDDNVYFLNSKRVSDFCFNVDPSFYFSFIENEIELGINTDFSYNQYFNNTNLSNLQSNTGAIVRLKPDTRTYVELMQDYEASSDPSFVDGEDRYKWVQNSFVINTRYKSDSTFWSIHGSFENYKRNYLDATYNNLDNNYYYFTLMNYFTFLPETSLILGIKTGFIDYIYQDLKYSNSNSTHYEFTFGVDGRLTNTVTLLLKLGFLWLDYDFDTDFHEPVIFVEFKDLFSQVSSASAGYERTAYDSTYSNFFIDNKLFMKFKSIFYDRLINLTTIQYIYRDYWIPNPRVDNRLGLITEFSYPITTIYKRNISVILTSSYEWVTSDAYDGVVDKGDGATIVDIRGSLDPAVDYKRFFISMGLTTKY